MADFFIQHFLSSMWGWIGTTGVIVIICGVVAWFVPPLRRIAIEVGAVVIAAATIYAKGQRDAKRKWNEAIERDVKKGEQARADAERDVAAGRVRDSEWDRDKGGV